MIGVIRLVWGFLRLLGDVLGHARFSLLVVVIASVALYTNEQAQDIMVGLVGYRVALFLIAVTWWAVQSWGWARYILNDAYPVNSDGSRGRAGMQRHLIDVVPRALGMVAFGVAIAASFKAGAHWALSAALALDALLLLAYFVYRRDLKKTKLGAVAERSQRELIALTLGIGVVSWAFAIVAPVVMGNTLGAGAVAFLGLGCIVPIGSMLVAVSREARVPVVTLTLALAFAFSFWNDNHGVRVIEDGDGTASVARQPERIADAFRAWRNQAPVRGRSNPLVLVATAGGGLRASYWTGAVLGALQDTIPEFHRSVFAISGVSGGSVGALFYDSALAARPQCAAADRATPCLQADLLAAIGRDYLGPVVASLLYGDLLQRFLPVAVLPDRAAALESAWERGFGKVFADAPCGLGTPFRDLRTEPCLGALSWLPLLLFNGTYEETGRRIVTSSLAVPADVFLDADDFYVRNGNRSIPASTAAHNSARFTYVSPAGTFRDGASEGHVVDGGYFENYGAETLEDLLLWIQSAGDPSRTTTRLVIIAISNDAKIERAEYEQTLSQPDEAAFANDVGAPLRALLNARGARGMLAYKSLRRSVEAHCESVNGCEEPVFAHFSLSETGQNDAPLGWVLSRESRQNMLDQLAFRPNCEELAKIAAAFGRPAAACR